MHAMSTTRTTRLRFSCSAAILIAAALAAAEARATEYGPVLRSDDPAFRTDLGIQLSLGGSSCIGGGTSYARCFGTDDQWDTRFGLNGGLIIRPFQHVSFGLDVGMMTLAYHQITANTWTDLLLGPTVRYHQPWRIRGKLYVEPNIGLQAGYVYGVLREKKDDSGTSVDYRHKHYGAFISIPFGLDFFPLPRVGIGLEFRVIRTFYTDVCFESADTVVCRGAHENKLVGSDVREASGHSAQYLGDKGTASYPWKLFWGIHGLYYF
jgi:hypothetical protein